MLEYIDLEYEPNEDELVCLYYIEPSKGVSFKKACTNIAGESSIDTWSDISTLSPEIAERLKPHVFEINEKTGEIKIAYSSELFEVGSIPQILSSIAGNIFSMKLLNNLRLQDISFPKEVVSQFKGPKFGLQGVRKLLKIRDRPLVGTIVKPKVGLVTEKHAEVAYNAWIGGCDIVKDDENLTNQKFNQFEKRAKLTLEARDKAEKETGEKKVYMCNITAPTCQEMLRRAKFIKKLGGEYIMIDIIPVGWTALQTLREANESLNLILHAHRCMHSALTRNPRHGVSMLVIAKLVRLIGLDQLHIGTVVGKMHGSIEEVVSIKDEIILREVEESKRTCILHQKWHGINPVFPVASGGLHPGHVPDLVRILGKDIIMQFGGGIHAHPHGTRTGAIAVRQAVESVLDGIDLGEYARNHEELKIALEKWQH
ncbi:MAG: type III ribulose-bisphosphate carboxylase [Candidatus Altiarchaeales archaeon]|nr:type III ribulose-bisphosphate carboxylase [Candidatus Altiarchaeota archaeon]MBU4341895.1 type III ribulose-bisphosphate carboxylase [Candidatus Altiarchaeota archaeon]MCG2782940.1 type III ribulose-bisphosphate carboxylase [Candidatus Altiarchaeales archaeon]